jgi:elongation factor Ts
MSSAEPREPAETSEESAPPVITADLVKALRDATGAGMMECKKALTESSGDMERAIEILRQKGLADAQHRAGRVAREGRIDSYIHFNGRVGVLVEVNCETDFVADTAEFKQLARDIALHVASAAPRWVTRDDVPADILDDERRIYEAQARDQGKPDHVLTKIVEGKLESFYKEFVLVDQPFVKDPDRTIGLLRDELAARVGEKIAVRRFTRFQVGEERA